MHAVESWVCDKVEMSTVSHNGGTNEKTTPAHINAIRNIQNQKVHIHNRQIHYFL